MSEAQLRIAASFGHQAAWMALPLLQLGITARVLKIDPMTLASWMDCPSTLVDGWHWYDLKEVMPWRETVGPRLPPPEHHNDRNRDEAERAAAKSRADIIQQDDSTFATRSAIALFQALAVDWNCRVVHWEEPSWYTDSAELLACLTDWEQDPAISQERIRSALAALPEPYGGLELVFSTLAPMLLEDQELSLGVVVEACLTAVRLDGHGRYTWNYQPPLASTLDKEWTTQQVLDHLWQGLGRLVPWLLYRTDPKPHPPPPELVPRDQCPSCQETPRQFGASKRYLDLPANWYDWWRTMHIDWWHTESRSAGHHVRWCPRCGTRYRLSQDRRAVYERLDP